VGAPGRSRAHRPEGAEDRPHRRARRSAGGDRRGAGGRPQPSWFDEIVDSIDEAISRSEEFKLKQALALEPAASGWAEYWADPGISDLITLWDRLVESAGNYATLIGGEIEAFIATGRQKHGEAAADGGASKTPKTEEMRARLREGGFEGPYRLRKQTVEPVFGQIKHARGFRQFLMRGMKKVAGEWAMLCTVHNILKLAGARAAA